MAWIKNGVVLKGTFLRLVEKQQKDEKTGFVDTIGKNREDD